MAYYTLIAYKPDASDYCMGCHMASYSSDFEMAHGASLAALAPAWKRALHADHNSESGDASYELNLLINGVPLSDIPTEKAWLEEGMDLALVDLAAEAYAWIAQIEAEVKVELEEAKQRAAAEKAEAELRAAQDKLAREHAEYLKLRARFEGAQHA